MFKIELARYLPCWLFLPALLAPGRTTAAQGDREDAARPAQLGAPEKIVLVAHRGASHAAPECTIPAFRLAF
jgi:hypothetical protein